MAYLVVLVLDNPEYTHAILDAWESAGASGVTIFESTGIGRVRRNGIIDDLPLMPSLGKMLRGRETHHRTLFSVVPSEEHVNALVTATQSVIGDLDEEHTGLLYAVPVVQVHGLKTRSYDDNG
jgi:hypothetical protein